MNLASRSTITPPRRPAPGRSLPVLGLALLLGACSTPELGFVDRLWSPFSGSANVVATDSLTAQRVRGANPEVDPLLPEPGNVWPEPEAPRPTLLSGPDEAFRNIPEYRPQLIEGAPPASSRSQARRSGAACRAAPPPRRARSARRRRPPARPPRRGLAPRRRRRAPRGR
jgi:hypothetical protein